MQNAIANIEKYARGKRVTAAVSGGADSMALLELLREAASRGVIAALSVVHVDHGLRPESGQEAKFVADYCAARQIPCAVYTVDVAARRARSGRGIEEEARLARREIFLSCLREGATDLVATAHHADDNAETVLLHLFRGCGVTGLGGMAVCDEAGFFRPLLEMSAAEIRAYAEKRQIPYRTDASNFDTSYDRNYLRHIVLPAVTERFPAAVAAIGRAARWAREAEETVRESLREDAFGRDEYGAVTLCERDARKPYIREALRRLGVTADVYAPTLARIEDLPHRRDGARVEVCKGVEVGREYGVLAFYRTLPAREKNLPVPFVAPAETARLSFGRATIRLDYAQAPTFPPPKGTLYVDVDALPATAVWRMRAAGDSFTPFGGGRRKLKEYFIDRKIPRRVRDELPLLCDGADVLVIAGVEISERVRIGEQTRRILRVRTEGICGE